MAPKQFVYAITRRDFDVHTDKKGALNLVEIHTDIGSANTAAKAHLSKELAKAPNHEDETNERENKDGGYLGQAWTRQDKRDNFVVEVKKMELKTEAPKGASTAGSKVPAKQATKRAAPEDEDEEDVEDDDEVATPAKKPAAKKAAKAPSKKSAVPEGKNGALKGLNVLFTGTFDSMDRKTSVETAETYGATIVKKLTDADFIVLGVKAGPNKIAEIEEKGLKTVNETDFLDLLKNPEQARKKLGV